MEETADQVDSPTGDVSNDYADLLLGLGDDELNDFDGLDDFGDGMDEQRIKDELEQHDPFYEMIESDIPAPLVGFKTAKGNKIKSPSAAAKMRAALLYAQAAKEAEEAEVDEDGEVILGKGRRGSQEGDGGNKRRKLDINSGMGGFKSETVAASPSGFNCASGTSSVSDKQRPDHDTPLPNTKFGGQVGFKTGSGATLPPPSAKALQKVARLFDDDIPDILDNKLIRPAVTQETSTGFENGNESMRHSSAIIPTVPCTPNGIPRIDKTSFNVPTLSPLKSAFTTGSGNAVAPLSQDAIARARDIFMDSDPNTSSQSTRPDQSPKQSAFQTGSGQSITALDSSARARALALLDGTPAQPSAADSTHPLASTSNTPVRKPAKNLFAREPLPSRFAPPRPTSENTSPSIPVRPTTPSRIPLTTTTNTFTQRQTDLTPMMTIKPIEIKATPNRRIGLGSSTSATRPKTKTGFVSPFKVAGTPSRVMSTPTKLRTSVTEGSKIPTPGSKPIVYNPVFDLNPPPNRQSYKEAYLHPGYFPPQELHEMGLPDEIWTLTPSNAASYRFISQDAEPMGSKTALERLQLDGCGLVSAKWVENHYSLILWKIAGIIQAKPSMDKESWHWEEVIRQLKYRYEREFGCAERSIIRRIQEHDSASGLPMGLCISAIHLSPAIKDEKGQVVTPRPVLELTDGWYRINAEVDDCLARGVEKGKITVGRKLSISGARLNSENDGAEVLEALDNSHLVISGNSTHLARWTARLGLQPQPFVAGLSSLSVDGGSIVLMDIVLDKIFPLAYMSSDKRQWDPPWDENEERVRQDQWKEEYTNESKRLHEEMRKNLEKIEDIASTLMSSAQELEMNRGTSTVDNVEDLFDEILAAKDVNARLRNLTDIEIFSLAQYAQQRMNRELNEGQSEVEAELRTLCPVRDVRDFRVVRFSDALKGRKEAMRIGMLNIWEAKALGEGSLIEGHRYQVTNLLPGRMGDWSPPKVRTEKAEIYLHTRRDTRWREVELGS